MDQQDLIAFHGAERAGRIQVIENRSPTMAGILPSGVDIEILPGSGYQGPGLYMMRLGQDEHPHAAYMVRRSVQRIRVYYLNPHMVFDVVQGGDNEWYSVDVNAPPETGAKADFELVASCERWPSDGVELPSLPRVTG